MPGISIHVVDVSRGVVRRDGGPVYAVNDGSAETTIAQGRIGRTGTLDAAAQFATLPRGRYRAVFHVGDYYPRSRRPASAGDVSGDRQLRLRDR